jgi:hypothetical protein
MMPQTAAQRPLYPAALAMAGGLFQTMIALALWPIRRFEPERHALAVLYRALARAAGQPSRATEAPAVSSQTNAAQ